MALAVAPNFVSLTSASQSSASNNNFLASAIRVGVCASTMIFCLGSSTKAATFVPTKVSGFKAPFIPSIPPSIFTLPFWSSTFAIIFFPSTSKVSALIHTSLTCASTVNFCFSSSTIAARSFASKMSVFTFPVALAIVPFAVACKLGRRTSATPPLPCTSKFLRLICPSSKVASTST